MEKNVKYRNDFENYPVYQVYYHRSIKYHVAHERFVVPWQMEENTKEKDSEDQ
ncbi:MAG: hypothetical protein PHN68_04735 [Prolixibacteraceae bacterium]|jgi:hypothetical protein|nr:hypothetical protein [Prolixibacteraceae bacterium]MDD4755179.1 hypothetical protein [Prolixibacteraceae bacterium]NLO02881.1 hypothetical protein [Bacteroidales bacterium]